MEHTDKDNLGDTDAPARTGRRAGHARRRGQPAGGRHSSREQRPRHGCGRRGLFGREHQGPGRARSGPEAARDVHRVYRSDRSAPSRLRGRRQRRRRSPGWLLRPDQRHRSYRRFGHRHRQRPRHPGRPARQREVRGRSGADRPPCGRQVRQRQLQGFRRSPRRRRLGRQCPVGNTRSGDLAQRPGLPADLRTRHSSTPAGDDRARRSAAARK